jgi:hypothetical protein
MKTLVTRKLDVVERTSSSILGWRGRLRPEFALCLPGAAA